MSVTELDAWIHGLVSSRIPEGPALDYKREMRFTSDTERAELCKDASSFANEIGGTVVYGVPEDRSGQAPVPSSPYGIAPIPGAVQDIERILSTAVSPRIEGIRVIEVPLGEMPGKMAYLLWTPRSWIAPHMVQGYGVRRYFKRGQYESVPMTEPEVERLYRQRLLANEAVERFLASRQIDSLKWMIGGRFAKTRLVIAPGMLIADRVDYSQQEFQAWLVRNQIAGNWAPSMSGVFSGAGAYPSRQAVELHKNGAVVSWKYSLVDNPNQSPPLVNAVREAQDLELTFSLAGALYGKIGYVGPLVIAIEIECPESQVLVLAVFGEHQRLEPSGTSARAKIMDYAANLTRDPHAVNKRLADGVAQAFGKWESDYT